MYICEFDKPSPRRTIEKERVSTSLSQDLDALRNLLVLKERAPSLAIVEKSTIQ